MNDRFIRRLADLAYGDIVDWVGERAAVRGFDYRDRVGGIFALDDGYAARVTGTDTYVTNLYADSCGEFCSVCTCPVQINCKHAAALAFVVAEALKAGREISSVTDAALRLDRAAIQKERREERVRRSQRELAAAREMEERENQEIAAIKQCFADERVKALEVCANGSAEAIRIAAENLMAVADSEDFCYYRAGAFDEDFEAYHAAMERIIASMRSRGMSAADVVVWAQCVRSEERSLCSSPAIEDALDGKGEYAAPEVQAEVARRLTAELDAFPERRMDGNSSDGARWADAIRAAWKRAGAEERALEVWVKHVDALYMWLETAEFLNLFGRYDEAIEVARRGVQFGLRSSDCGNEYHQNIQGPLADAFSGKGDHLKAAAIRAEQFLSYQGCDERYRTVDLFERMMDEAEKAGVKRELYAAIVHALETGRTPKPLIDWPAEKPKPANPWCKPPKRIEFRSGLATQEEPPWPLPRANEGLKHAELRWDAFLDWCQFDQEFLLKLAIANGDVEEAAIRFSELPHFPIDSNYYGRSVAKMIDDLTRLMEGRRPDIVESIRNHPTWRKRDSMALAPIPGTLAN